MKFFLLLIKFIDLFICVFYSPLEMVDFRLNFFQVLLQLGKLTSVFFLSDQLLKLTLQILKVFPQIFQLFLQIIKMVIARTNEFLDSAEDPVQESFLVITIIVTVNDSLNNLFDFIDITIFDQFVDFLPRWEFDDIFLFKIVDLSKVEVWIIFISHGDFDSVDLDLDDHNNINLNLILDIVDVES